MHYHFYHIIEKHNSVQFKTTMCGSNGFVWKSTNKSLSTFFVSLFVWGCSSHLRIFHSYWDVTIFVEGLQILTYMYAQQSWPLCSEGSLACNIYCDTGHPLIIVIFEDTWHSHLLPSVLQWSCHCLYKRLRSVETGIRTPSLPHAG